MDATLPRPRRQRSRTPKPETGLVRKRLSDLKPTPENETLYRPVLADDPEIRALAQSIIDNGLKEPLVVTLDDYILSGHRRHAAATLAGLIDVPCRIEPITYEGNIDEVVRLLREYNRQRHKSHAEKLREEIVSMDANECHRRLVEYREAAAATTVKTIKLGAAKSRSEISAAKMPMLNAIINIINQRAKFWPLNNRMIHYAMLNNPPLRHASKADSRYANDLQSYKDLCDVLTRARLTGEVPMEAIDDSTRPFFHRAGFADVQQFIRNELRTMFRGYRRDLLQAQPNHVEVLAEKNTVAPICRAITDKYCVPLTSGRGYSSIPPRRDMAERFNESGKERLIVLIVSDFDPEGEDIAESFARSMRDDFDLCDVEAVKVALTREQATQYKLPEDATAKVTSSRYKKFVRKYGRHVWELEALPPETLQSILEDAIVSVLDMDAFHGEVNYEVEDARFLECVRKQMAGVMESLDLEGIE